VVFYSEDFVARTVRLHTMSNARLGCDNPHNLLKDFLIANLIMLTKAFFA